MKKISIIVGIIVFTLSTLLQLYIIAEYINPIFPFSNWIMAMVIQFIIFALINGLLLFVVKKIFKYKKR